MSFAEYERKFNELSKFGPSLIDTPLKKNEKCIAGAHLEYYSRLISHVHSSFTQLMDMAIRYENPTSKGPAVSGAQSSSANSKKRKPHFQQQKNWQKRSGLGSSSSAPAQRQPVDLSSITCFRCDQRGHYANSCPTLSGAAAPPPVQSVRRDLCHICLQPGHFKKDCPTQHRGTPSGIFAVTSASSPVPPLSPTPSDDQVTLQGSFTLFHHPVRVFLYWCITQFYFC